LPQTLLGAATPRQKLTGVCKMEVYLVQSRCDNPRRRDPGQQTEAVFASMEAAIAFKDTPWGDTYANPDTKLWIETFTVTKGN